jgi:hypothetical protein
VYAFVVNAMLFREFTLAMVPTIGAYAIIACPLRANAIATAPPNGPTGITYCVPDDIPYRWDVLRSVGPDTIASTDIPSTDILPIGWRKSKIATQDGFFWVIF